MPTPTPPPSAAAPAAQIWRRLKSTMVNPRPCSRVTPSISCTGTRAATLPTSEVTPTTIVNNLRALSKFSKPLFGYIRTNYDNFMQLSDGTFKADGFSFYVTTGAIDGGKVGIVCSVLDDLYQSPKPPIWNAIAGIVARGVRLQLNN